MPRYALFQDGKQITEATTSMTAAYIDAKALRECYDNLEIREISEVSND